MGKLLTTILGNTFRQSDLKHRLVLLRQFLEFRFFKAHKNENLVFQLNEFFVSKKESRDEFNALNSWGYSFFSQFNKENSYKNLDAIEVAVQTLPVMTVYLPLELPIYEIPKLGAWLRLNVADNLIFDLKIDRALIGGCALAYRGNYRDFSLKFYLEKNKAAVKRVIEDYLELKLKVQRVNQPQTSRSLRPAADGVLAGQ